MGVLIQNGMEDYPHLSAIEYTGSWDPEKAEELKSEILTRAQELIDNGSENSLRFMSVEEMSSVCKHVPANLPTNKPARVVMYGSDFGIPCGGTHLKNIADVGKIDIPKLKQKKGIIRLKYKVEGIEAE